MSQDPTPLTGSASSFSDDMSHYLQVYLDESTEELEALIEAVLQLEVNPRNSEALHKAFRMLHSLKGSSGMLGFEVVGGFAHELEDRFERYRSGQAVLDRDTTTLVLKCVDYFRSFLDRLRAGDQAEGDPEPLLIQLRELEQRPVASKAAGLPALTISGGMRILIRFREGLQLVDLKARLIVSRLSSIGEIIATDPAVEDLHSVDEIRLFSLTLATDQSIDQVRKIANVDGVDSVEIAGGDPAPPVVKAPQPATPAPVAPAAVPAPPSAPAPLPTVAVATEAEPGEQKSQASETLRVEIGRLDHLMNLTGELVVANARFGQITGEMSPLFRRNTGGKKSKELADRVRQRFDQIRESLADLPEGKAIWTELAEGLQADLDGLEKQSELWAEGHRRFSEISDAVDQLSRVSKNLQRGVLNTRMVPVGPLFNRFKRVVRDLSVERQKQVHLSIQGEKTELDKRMIDALGDPLLHLVRNSIDHGLESAAERRAAGKPETGTIELEALHRGNNVLITVRDDGRGIDLAKVRSRIVARGLASEQQAQELTDPQAMAYIWHPGFSTAEAVTEISGRGVGMDIVSNAISELSGTIDVASTPGAGAIFTIRLPLTLAIIHSLLIRFRDDFYSVPIDDVREIVSVPREQIHAVHRHRTIDVRGELIPLVSMSNIFQWNHLSPRTEPKGQAGSSNGTVNVVILHARAKTLGLSVDSLVGRADLVIKSLAENYSPVRGLSGASIQGDGAVCLMLDSAALIDLASERVMGRAAAEDRGP